MTRMYGRTGLALFNKILCDALDLGLGERAGDLWGWQGDL